MSPADLDLARQRLHDRRRALLARYHRTLDLVDEELDSREIEDVDTSSEQWDAQVLTALSVADRVYCLMEGRVTLTGRPAEVTREAIHAAYFGEAA